MLLPITLLLAASNVCFTDTDKADFDLGVLTSVATTADGNVQLQPTQTADQGNAGDNNYGYVVNNTYFMAQTFTPAVSGPLTKLTTTIRCFSCGASAPALKVAIRATTGNPALPTGGDLATATIPGFTDAISRPRTVEFATPLNVVAGVTYMLYVGTSVPQSGQYEITRDNTNSYSRGGCVFSGNSGATWAPCMLGDDLAFQTTVGFPFATSGTFVSQVRQIDPLVSWSTMTFSRTVLTNTTLRVQVAASTSPTGPFTYVGPDGTSGTNFAASASLAQFAGQPYLRYRAVLSSTDHDITPSLGDVRVCYQTLTTTMSTPSVSAIYPSTIALEATLTVPSGPVVGRNVSFSIGGVFAGSSPTDNAGVARVDVSNPGAGVAAFVATFAGDSIYDTSNVAGALNVAKAAQVIVFDPPTTASVSTGSLQLMATGGLAGTPVVLSASSPHCHVAGTTLFLDSPGTCTVRANQAGNANFEDAPEVARDIELTKTPQTVSFEALSDFVWRGGSATLVATSTSGLPVAFSVVSGPCVISGSTVTSAHAGECVIAAAQAGDEDYLPATTQTQTVVVGKVTADAIVFAPLADVRADVGPFQLSATGGGASTRVTFSTSSTACSLIGDVVIVAKAGTCSIDANQAADGDYVAAVQVSQAFEVLAVAPVVTEPQPEPEPEPKPATGCGCNASTDVSSFLFFALAIVLRRRSR